MIDAYEYLSSIRAVEIRIRTKTDQVHRLRDRVNSIPAPPLDKDHVAHTKDPAAMQKTLAMILRASLRPFR